MIFHVIGLDISTKKIAVVVSDQDGKIVEVVPYMLSKNVHKRYHDAYRVGRAVSSRYAKFGAVYSFPEKPIFWRGGRSTLPLAQISGALIAGLCAGGSTSIVDSMNTQWKKDTVGNGNAKKPQIAAYLKKYWRTLYEYIEANHTTGVRKPVPDQDLIDAACINVYGHQVVARMIHQAEKQPIRKLARRKR